MTDTPEAPPPLAVKDRAPRLTRRNVLFAAPYFLTAFLYLATSPFQPGLNNPNEMVRVYMSKAMVDHRTMSIDGAIREWGGVDDKAVRDGKLYSSKAPLQSLIGAPIYEIYKRLFAKNDQSKRRITTVLRLFGSTLFGLLFSLALIAWLQERGKQIGAPPALGSALGVASALGTMLYPYSLTFTGHILAGASAGGAYLCLLSVLRHERDGTFRLLALVAGFLAGATPFAEYPAALMVLPALFAAIVALPSWRHRAELVLFLALGGALPFFVGMWAHHVQWGSPFRTGYTFLENRAYVEVHKEGFFGVGLPEPKALLGALFSPGTGLFFFSPFLLVGLLGLVVAVFSPRRPPQALPRSLAIAGLTGVLFELAFIGGHTGWRGGWTLGPRYIIAVAPVLSIWALEAHALRFVRAWLAPLAALSILTTGFASAIYPHLSDVYTNPLVTFLWPSYQRGFGSYGLAQALSLDGHLANAVHVVPLLLAMALAASGTALLSGDKRQWARSVLSSVFIIAAFIAGIRQIEERDGKAAAAENDRLFGFWEPKRKTPAEPGLLFDARERWSVIAVSATSEDGTRRPCQRRPTFSDRCFYGEDGWQRFGPDHLEFDGRYEPILFLHPLGKGQVQARIPVPEGARRGVLRYGLADASARAQGLDPVDVRLRQGDLEVLGLFAENRLGLHRAEFTLSATLAAPLWLELRVPVDGARVFGFDLKLYR